MCDLSVGAALQPEWELPVQLKVSNLPIAIYFKCETRMGTIVKKKKEKLEL